MIRDFILELLKFVGELNYWHVALLAALESTCFPVVVPVETIIIPMGYYAFLGQKSLSLLILITTLGIVTGCIINYYFAYFLGRKVIYKYGKYVHLNVDSLKRLEKKFLKHGRLLMFIGRFIPIPAFKHIITIPAGISKMPLGQFIFYNALGGFIFSTSMLLIGYFFGSNEVLMRGALNNFTYICIGLFTFYISVKVIIKIIINTKKKNGTYNEEKMPFYKTKIKIQNKKATINNSYHNKVNKIKQNIKNKQKFVKERRMQKKIQKNNNRNKKQI